MDSLDLTHPSLPIRQDFLDYRRLVRFLDRYPVFNGPQIIDFHPWTGHPSTLMVIVGRGFAESRRENVVIVGGIPALVISATKNRLVVITNEKTESGAVQVALEGGLDELIHVLNGPRDFVVLDTPSGNLELDGPPIMRYGETKGWLSYSQTGASYLKQPDDDLPDDGPTYPVPTQEQLETSNGQPFRANVFVLPVYPNDLPTPTAADRQTVIDRFDQAAEFYNQATYGMWSFSPRVLDWQPLANDDSYYHDSSTKKQNIKDSVLYELFWEALTVNQDTLNGPGIPTIHMYVVVYFSNGVFLRGVNFGQVESFTIRRGSQTITVKFNNLPGAMCISETSAWGRMAHEIGHTMVRTDEKTMVFPEDMYEKDLIDGAEATAERFEMMGAHDTGPLFSAYFMLQRGWYQAWNYPPTGLPVLLRPNVFEITWKADPLARPFSHEYDLVAHGDQPNRLENRWHIIKIKIAQGLDYFIEVRERPPPGSSQIFDSSIPLPSSGNTGGVVVTRVLSGQKALNLNQQTRTIALLHGRDRVRVLDDGEEVHDPARGIKITVVRNPVSTNPWISRVRVEYNQQPPPDNPASNVDLSIKKWNDDCDSEDIWINRWLDKGKTQPNKGWPPTAPVDNGEAPLVPSAGDPQRHDFVARIHNNGTADAFDVNVVHYVNTPPGIGDNGTWGTVSPPQDSHNVGTVQAGKDSYSIVTWTPVVAQHTCLQVHIVAQTDDRTASNNFAQENIFKFDTEASSPGKPVEMVVAVRNPLDRRALIRVEVDGVRRGFAVYFPHRWVWLDAKAEKHLTLLVIPVWDIAEMKPPETRRTKVRVMGFVARHYEDVNQPSWWSSIGGITMQVTCKHTAKVILEEKPVIDVRGVLQIKGYIEPRTAGIVVFITAEKSLGDVLSAYTKTNESGEFEAGFHYNDLKDESGLMAAFQGSIVDSAEFISAESNIVHWRY